MQKVSLPPPKYREACGVKGPYTHKWGNWGTEYQNCSGSLWYKHCLRQVDPHICWEDHPWLRCILYWHMFVLLSCTIYNKDFHSVFPAADSGIERKTPNPWDHLFVSALAGMCYTQRRFGACLGWIDHSQGTTVVHAGCPTLLCQHNSCFTM